MAQIKSGLVSVTSGSQIVSGSNTTWLSDGVEAGHSFIIQGEGIVYDIASVDSETQITLSGNYAGSTKTDVAYVIATDFTPNQNYVELDRGNLESAAIFTRSLRKIDTDVAARELTSNLGTAAYDDVMSSLTDTTAGRLMPVGAGGLLTGRSATNEDIEAIKTSRFFYQGNNATNKFGGGSNGTVLSAVGLDDDGGYGWQFGKLNSGPWKGRRLNGGVWQEDEIFYTSQNILGTVSQSGGVPTGAVIERGSNANGEYVKFADGTMICQKEFSGLDCTTESPSGIFRSAGISWTFPVPFISSRWVGGGRITSTFSALTVHLTGTTASSSSEVRFYTVSSLVSQTGQVFAIGRWF